MFKFSNKKNPCLESFNKTQTIYSHPSHVLSLFNASSIIISGNIHCKLFNGESTSLTYLLGCVEIFCHNIVIN